MAQAPCVVVMIRPHLVQPNLQTLADNRFQQASGADPNLVARRAYDEVTVMAGRLLQAGVQVHLFEDTSGLTPDSGFPNNWLSTHPGGDIVLYPNGGRQSTSGTA